MAGDTIYTVAGEHFAGAGFPTFVIPTPTNPTSNEVATQDTIRRMIGLAKAESREPLVQIAVAEALDNVPDVATARDQVEAIFNWVRSHVAFKDGDELMRELWGIAPGDAQLQISPVRLLTMANPQGACNDQSTLLAAMLLNLEGLGVGFVTVGADLEEPDRWSHVYVEALLPCGERMPLDVSHGPFAGWEETEVSKRRVYPIRGLKGADMIIPYDSGLRSGRPGMLGLGSIDWGSLLTTGVKTTSDILSSRYGVPPQVTVVTTNDQGQQVIRYPTNSTVGLSTFPSPLEFETGGSDIIKWGLIVAVIIVGAKALGK